MEDRVRVDARARRLGRGIVARLASYPSALIVVNRRRSAAATLFRARAPCSRGPHTHVGCTMHQLARACLGAMLLIYTHSVEAQTVHDRVKPNIVLLTASGQAQDGGRLPPERRTGVIVSAAGWLLSSYDLIGSFTSVKPGSLIVTARGTATQDRDVRVAIIDFSEHLNLLFLALPVGEYPHFVLPSESAPEELYVSGYQDAENFYPGSRGDLKPLDPAADASLRGINIDDSGVLAGSPVYNSDGQLLGLVQSEDDEREILFRPISYAVPLLLTVRTDNIVTTLNTRLPEQRAAELEAALRELRTSVAFNPAIDAKGKKLVINYDKMLAEPALEYIDVSVIAVDPPTETPVGPSEPVRLTRRNPDPNDATKGSFDATADLFAAIENTKTVLPGTTGFKFRIIGKLEDAEGRPGLVVPSVEIAQDAPF
jgi:hypothetical protein